MWCSNYIIERGKGNDQNLREVVHDELGGHRLAGARLPADDDALVLVVNLHVAVHVVREGVDVGRVLVGRLPNKIISNRKPP